jgi:hypothetical protein
MSPRRPAPIDPLARLTLAWRAYRAGVCEASRAWSRLSPGEVREVRARLDALRAEVIAAEDAYDAPIPFTLTEKGAA